MILRDHGYACDEAIVYYAATKQRVRIPIDPPLVQAVLETIERARQLVAAGQIPPPLADSPKCPRCSLVGICLPDETNWCSGHGAARSCWVQKTLFETDSPWGATVGVRGRADQEIRRLVPARDDLRPLYLNTQGLSVGKSGEVLKIKERNTVVQEVRLKEICQLNLMANEPKRNPCWFANLPQKLLLALELAPDRCPVIVIGVTRPDHFRRNITTLHLGKLM